MVGFFNFNINATIYLYFCCHLVIAIGAIENDVVRVPARPEYPRDGPIVTSNAFCSIPYSYEGIPVANIFS